MRSHVSLAGGLSGIGAVIALTLMGCSGGGSGPASTAPSPQDAADLEASALPGGDAMPAAMGQAALGGYTLTVNADELSGSTEMWRRGQQTDDTYFLSVDNFLQPSSFVVDGVSGDANSIRVNYTFTHPFKASLNLDAPATAANREDLAISARLLILADVPTGTASQYTFFSGEAIAYTDLLTNADGYYAPKGLLTNTGGLTANTFPYKLVVDEGAGADGNRDGISNNGSGEGNYRPLEGGWQRINIDNGGVNNGWTGFDVLHQGQAAKGQLVFDRAILAAGPVDINVAVIAKYIDPRGGTTSTEKRANRLPPAALDVTKFVYRFPHGAIDCGRVGYLGESGGLLPNNAVSATTVRVHVRDYDARGIVSSRTDLNDDPDPTTIVGGTEGVPTLTIDVPTVTLSPSPLAVVDDDSAYGGDAQQDNGPARDELFFSGLVQNSAASPSQVNGLVRGLMKVTDAANGADRSAYEFALDPDLTLLTSNQPELVTYQALALDMGGGTLNDPPTATLIVNTGSTPVVASGGVLDLWLQAESDPESNPVLYDVDWSNDGSFEITGADPAGVPPPDVLVGSGTAPVNGGAVNAPHQVRVRFDDAFSPAPPTIVLLDYLVAPAGANTPPTANITLLDPNPPSGGALTYQLNTENDPDADTVLYSIDYDYGGVFTPDAASIDPSAPPTTLHISTAQVNPGATPLSRTTRVQYTDGINPPINVDLPYTLGPSTCSSRTQTWDFEAGTMGWIDGPSFSLSPLPNADITGWGHFRHSLGCAVIGTEGASSGGISGGYWMSGDDGDNSFCSFRYDYGSTADYNIISPWINVPTICNPGSLQVIFNGYLFSRAGSVAELYVSTDQGVSWGAPVWSSVSTEVGTALTNTAVSLSDTLAGQTILLRFRFTDPTASTWSLPSPFNNEDNNAGLALDNIRITAGATAPFTNNPPVLPCGPRSMNFPFDTGAGGWTGGENAPFPLPNGDSIGIGGVGGYSALRWTDCTTANGNFNAVNISSAGAISGSSLNNCNDHGSGSFCGGFTNDYAGTPAHNVVSPRIMIPANCAGGTVALKWNAYLNTDDSAYVDPFWENGFEDGPDTTVDIRAYTSTNNGSSWNIIWSVHTTAGVQNFLNQTVDITGFAGNPGGVRVRFEFVGTDPDLQMAGTTDPFGFYVDNVRLESTNTNSIYYTF